MKKLSQGQITDKLHQDHFPRGPEPTSALAQACLNELRQLRGKRGGRQ